MTDMQYLELRRYAYRYALKIIKNEHDAQDIVQNSLLKMYVKEEDIENHKSYLLQCVKTNAINLIRIKKKEIDIKDVEAITDDFEANSEENEVISEDVAKTLLSVEDFRTYKMYIKYRKIKDIAKARKIPEGTAKRQVAMMKKNLEAAILKSKGHTKTTNILTFQQIENIRNFIKLISQKDRDLSKMHKYFEHTECPVMDMARIIDWTYSISPKEENTHRLHLTYCDSNKQPHFPVFYFYLDKKNYMKIKSVRFGEIVRILKPEDINQTKSTGNGYLYPKGYAKRKKSLSLDLTKIYKQISEPK